MAAELTGLRAPRPDPEPHACAVCGPTWDADRGFPGGVWYCTPCVPPELRFPWEAGYSAPSESGLPPPAAVRASEAAPDLLTGLVPA